LAREAGIGCGSCHVVPAGVVGTRTLPGRGGGHAVLGDARLSTPSACGRCHQFAFPAPPGIEAGPMQDTLGEHARSSASATACQGCHMPPTPSRGGGTHRSHAFRVQGDRAMLAQAVVVQSAELARGEVRLTLAPGVVGHAFPTGDLHRRAEVRAEPIDPAGHVLAPGSSEALERTFTLARAGRDTTAACSDRTAASRGLGAWSCRCPPRRGGRAGRSCGSAFPPGSPSAWA
jgi:hypothetical protein